MTCMRYEKVSDKEVTNLLTTKSGKYIVSAADSIKVWDPDTGESGVMYDSFREAEGVRVISNDLDRNYQLSRLHKDLPISLSTGDCVEELKGKNQSAQCLAESSDILVAGYSGMECYGYLWNLATGMCRLLYSFTIPNYSHSTFPRAQVLKTLETICKVEVASWPGSSTEHCLLVLLHS